MMIERNKLKILFWNARGIQHKLFELYEFLDDNFVDLCCISETHLKPTIHLHAHPNYYIYRFDRTDTRLGGVLAIIRRNIKHDLMPSLNTALIETIGIEVHSQRRKIQIISCYVPGGASSDQIRTHFENDVNILTRRNSCFFAVGDFNAKHASWNCNRSNLSGRILFEKAADNGYFVLHSADHTHHPSNSRQQPSTIDLIVTNGHRPISEPVTTSLVSDHCAVLFEIELNENIQSNILRTRFDYKAADWKLYGDLIDRELLTDRLHIDDITEIEQIDNLVS